MNKEKKRKEKPANNSSSIKRFFGSSPRAITALLILINACGELLINLTTNNIAPQTINLTTNNNAPQTINLTTNNIAPQTIYKTTNNIAPPTPQKYIDIYPPSAAPQPDNLFLPLQPEGSKSPHQPRNLKAVRYFFKLSIKQQHK